MRSVVFDKPPGRNILWCGYRPGGLENGPKELDTTGYPPGEVSYGRGTRRSESIVILSIISPILSTLSILHDRGLSYLSYSIYRPGGVSYGLHTSRAEYEMVLSHWGPMDTHQVEYPMSGIPAGRRLS